MQLSAETSAATEMAGPPAVTASSAYRNYVMVLLLAGCALNFLDRGVINILAEPIKLEFHLKDAGLGLLTGTYFALFYSVLSIPIARVADKSNRAWVIAACMAVWSLFTVASGFARSYLQLAICRLAVGVGEAGGSPTSQALVADYTPRERRASAISFYTIGIPIGSLLGLVLGGLVLDRYGWRTAFVVAGAPGVLVALLILLTLKEPRETASRPRVAADAPALGEALREIFSKRSFVLLTAGGAAVSMVNYAQSAFLPSYFFRNHGAELQGLATQAGGVFGAHLGAASVLGPVLGVASGVAAIIGTLAGGWLTDRAARRDMRAYVTIQVVFTLLRLPLFCLAMAAPTAMAAIAALAAQSVCTGIAGGPAYAGIQGLVQPRVRATAAGIFLLGLNLVGLGLGPLSAGALSDAFAAHGMTSGAGLATSLLVISEIVLFIAAALIAASRSSFRRDTVS